jgi:hypothetical protein
MPKVTGVAIAARVGDYLECLLSQGHRAPPAGARGEVGKGLSGACLATQAIQLCNDTKQDDRVDRKACEELHARSVLILPIKHDSGICWLLEVFSSEPNAFSWRMIRQAVHLIKRLDLNALEHHLALTDENEQPAPSTPTQESVNGREFIDIGLQKLLEAAWVIQQHKAASDAGAVDGNCSASTPYPQASKEASESAVQSNSNFQTLFETTFSAEDPPVFPEPLPEENPDARQEDGVRKEIPLKGGTYDHLLDTSDARVPSVNKVDEAFANQRPTHWLAILSLAVGILIACGSVLVSQWLGSFLGHSRRNPSKSSVKASFQNHETPISSSPLPDRPNYKTFASGSAGRTTSKPADAETSWNLAMNYFRGNGVPKNDVLAAEYLKRAANLGDRRAEKALSHFYLQGVGVPRDYVRAYTWASIAQRQGADVAADLSTIRKRMTDADLRTAERRVQAWTERHRSTVNH